jgi:hypothetical protein
MERLLKEREKELKEENDLKVKDLMNRHDVEVKKCLE